jgi:site-specific recombinase XerD
VPASSKSRTELASLLSGYQFCALSEGKSPKTIDGVFNSVRYLEQFLSLVGVSGDAAAVGTAEIRGFILYLSQKPCFSNHPYIPQRERGLSPHSINSYLRALRSFFSWLVAEGVLETSPFLKLKLPRVPHKVIKAFTRNEIQQLLSAIDIKSPCGYRNYAIILTLLDTGLRVSELTGLQLTDVRFEEGTFKVLGKGNRERFVPFGKEVQHCLWHYCRFLRPLPSSPASDYLFLTQDGNRLNKNLIETLMTRYARKCHLTGVRCSPHTLRHTAAISFLRNHGDIFSLQRLLGHSSLEMTRRYCEVADVDVKLAHNIASPVDNWQITKSLRKSGR